MHISKRNVRSNGVRTSIPVVYFRKFYKMHQNIVRIRFFFRIAIESTEKNIIEEPTQYRLCLTKETKKVLLRLKLLSLEHLNLIPANVFSKRIIKYVFSFHNRNNTQDKYKEGFAVIKVAAIISRQSNARKL